METIKASTTQSTDKKESQVTHILYALQFALEEFQAEVLRTSALHKIGEKTKLAKNIEDTINNPLDSLYKMSNNIDSQCISLLDAITNEYFTQHKNILSSVYRTDNTRGLHYAIVLKNDSAENRNSIFNFFDLNALSEALEKYPVYFQFTTDETIGKIKAKIPAIKKLI